MVVVTVGWLVGWWPGYLSSKETSCGIIRRGERVVGGWWLVMTIRRLPPPGLSPCGWWLVVGGWWLVVGQWF